MRGLRDERLALLQPVHRLAELEAVVTRLSPHTVERQIAALVDLNLAVAGGPSDYQTASRLSRDLGHHLFDPLNHAVAWRADATVLVAADERYYRKAKGRGQIVLLAEVEA